MKRKIYTRNNIYKRNENYQRVEKHGIMNWNFCRITITAMKLYIFDILSFSLNPLFVFLFLLYTLRIKKSEMKNINARKVKNYRWGFTFLTSYIFYQLTLRYLFIYFFRLLKRMIDIFILKLLHRIYFYYLPLFLLLNIRHKVWVMYLFKSSLL